MSMGPLLSLLSRLTQGRANNLDLIDTPTSTRADATHYTESRAQKLDSIDADISTRADQVSVDNILGAGFDINTDSLPALRTQMDNMAGSGFSSADHTISNSDPSGGNDGDIWFKI